MVIPDDFLAGFEGEGGHMARYSCLLADAGRKGGGGGFHEVATGEIVGHGISLGLNRQNSRVNARRPPFVDGAKAGTARSVRWRGALRGFVWVLWRLGQSGQSRFSRGAVVWMGNGFRAFISLKRPRV